MENSLKIRCWSGETDDSTSATREDVGVVRQETLAVTVYWCEESQSWVAMEFQNTKSENHET